MDNLGNPVIATEDITINLAFETKQCGDPYPLPTVADATILTGTSSISYGYTQERSFDCGQGECQTETEFFQSITGISPSSYSLCPEPTTTTTTTLTCSQYVLSVANVSGESASVEYLNCAGVLEDQTIYWGSSISFCASSIIAENLGPFGGLSLIGPCGG